MKEDKMDVTFENKFWIVVNNAFPTRVSHKHVTFESADTEAKRLSRENKGAKFVVLESKVGYEIQEFQKTNFVDKNDNPNDPDYIPF